VLGYSYNAVLLSIWLTCLVHLLCLLAAAALGRQRVSPQLLARLGVVFLGLTAAEVQPRATSAAQLPLPCLLADTGPAP
jgi:hypothetical protein